VAAAAVFFPPTDFLDYGGRAWEIRGDERRAQMMRQLAFAGRIEGLSDEEIRTIADELLRVHRSYLEPFQALIEAGVTGHRQEDLAWCVGPPLFDSVTKLLSATDADVGLAPSIVDAYRARYLEEIRDLLLQAWPTRGGARARLRRAIGHALEFRTWQSLVRRQGCATEEAVRLMAAFASSAPQEAPSPANPKAHRT
jgi:hypothetical protein